MFNAIDTGYKPEFALGALYQGQNAADRDAQNQEELIRQFLANQHSIQNDPILENQNRAELVSKRYGAARDQAKMDNPQFIPQLLAGEMGQQAVTEAAGAEAKALLPFKIALAKEIATGGLDEAKLKSLLARFNIDGAQPQPTPDAAIPEGFSMPNPGVSNAGRAAFFPANQPAPIDGDFVNAIRHVESRGNMNAVSPAGAESDMQVMDATNRDPGYGVTPAKDNSLAERSRVGQDYAKALLAKYGNQADAAAAYNMGPGAFDKWVAGGRDPSKMPKETREYIPQVMSQLGASQPQPVFSNMQVADNSDRDRVLNIMRDTAEQRNKVDLAKQAQDAAAAKSAANSAALLAIAEARARAQQGKEPTTAEAAKTRLILNDPNLDPTTRDALLNEIMNSKFGMGKNATGQQFGIIMDGNKIQPGMQTTVPAVTGTIPSSKTSGKTLSAEDQQAKEWAMSHLNDPRAKEILNRLVYK